MNFDDPDQSVFGFSTILFLFYLPLQLINNLLGDTLEPCKYPSPYDPASLSASESITYFCNACIYVSTFLNRVTEYVVYLILSNMLYSSLHPKNLI